MDYQLARLFRERWAVVNKIQKAEARASTMEQSWQEFNAIFNMAKGLRLPLANRDTSTEAVMQRWNKLKQRQG